MSRTTSGSSKVFCSESDFRANHAITRMDVEPRCPNSEYISISHTWRNVAFASSGLQWCSSDFGRTGGFQWKLNLVTEFGENQEKTYSIYLFVVFTQGELEDKNWSRDIRQFNIYFLNAHGTLIKEKTSWEVIFKDSNQSWGHTSLVDYESLMRDSVTAEKGAIDIVCIITYKTGLETITETSLLPLSEDKRLLPEPSGINFGSLLDSAQFSDVVIRVGGEDRVECPAHRNILASRSEWFASALTSGLRETVENVIDLPDDDPKVFTVLLRYLYTNEYDEEKAAEVRRLDVYKMADKFGVVDLGQLVIQRIIGNLQIDSSLVETMRSVYDLQPTQSVLVRRQLVRYISRHFDKIRELAGFQDYLSEGGNAGVFAMDLANALYQNI